MLKSVPVDGVAICPRHFEEQIAHLASVLLYCFNNLWEGSTVEKKLQFELSRFGLVQLRQVTTNFIVRTEGCPVVVEVGSSGFQSWANKKDVGEITLCALELQHQGGGGDRENILQISQ